LPVSKETVVVWGCTVETALHERNVEDGAVEVNELEHVHLEGECVFVLSLGSVHLWKERYLGTEGR
jgi:hypothetical protein